MADSDAVEKVKVQVEVYRQLALVIIDTIADVHPDPAPSGPMYMAFMSGGASLETFNTLLDICVKSGRIKGIGSHCYVLSDEEIKRRGLNGH